MAGKLAEARAVVAICPSCGDIGIMRKIGGTCWMCGGWIGFTYPFKMAMRICDMMAGRGSQS